MSWLDDTPSYVLPVRCSLLRRLVVVFVVACQRWQYKTMVTAMDRSIGLLLDAIRDLGVENNTLVVFTSGE